MKTAILYFRVSTDEQAEKGYSLQYQEEQLRRYCEVNNIQVIGAYTEDFSAKTFNRPEFKKMLLSFKQSTQRPNLLLFTKWDRFSRNISSAYEMIGILDGFGVEPHAIEQPLDISVPENQLMLAIYLAAPYVENLRRGLNVVGGMRRAKKEGRFMGGAPIGYKNVTVGEGKKAVKTIVPDKDADTIIWLFKEINKKVKTPAELRGECKKKGLSCSRSRFYSLLRDPTYCGKIKIPAYKNEEETVVMGLHVPLISVELFDEVQDVLNGRARKISYKICAKPELPLRGYLECPRCRGKLTGSASTGGSGKKVWYYHCKDGCKERIPAGKVNSAFEEKLKEIQFNDEVIQLYQKVTENLFGSDNIEKNNNQRKVNLEIQKYEQQLSKMLELLSNNEISSEDFAAFKKSINPKISELKIQIIEVGDVESELKRYLKNGMQLIKNISKVYNNAPLDGKQKIIRSIFKENIVFEENVVRTGKVNEVLPLISQYTNGFEGNKKRTEGDIDLQSSKVPGTGVEPVRFPTGV
jgi:site-specific DNA recombinase